QTLATPVVAPAERSVAKPVETVQVRQGISSEVYPLTSPVLAPIARLTADDLKQAAPPPELTPVLAVTARALASLNARHDASADKLARVVMHDPICTLHLMREVNQIPAVRQGEAIVRPSDAITAMGLDAFARFVEALPVRPGDDHPCL